MQRQFPFAVLQVTPALNSGGVERTTIELCEALVAAGGRAVVASRGGRMERELERAGGELVRLPMDSKNPAVVLANVRHLRQLAQTRRVRLIHARSRAPAWSALAAARLLRLPLVTTYHGIYSATSPLKRFYNSVMARGDVVIANSNYTRAHVLQTHNVAPERVVAIPRGVDLARFDPDRIPAERIERMREALRAPAGDRRFLVLMPTRLTRWKGQRVLLEAVARLEAEQSGRLRVVIAGAGAEDGALERELTKIIATMGLGGVAHVAGPIDDMPAALAIADCAAFPSVRPEAFGRGSIEAQAMRVPVIAADHGGLAETLVHRETGLLIPPNDPSALADALHHLLNLTPEERAAMGAAGRARVQAGYSAERLKAATLDIYARLIGEARA